MTRKIVLASGNAGKVREINKLFSDYGINVIPQTEFDVPEAIEDGLSFVENAIIKARNAAQHSGLPAIADDSGIEVDALNHRPGIYSARYSGEDANDQTNNDKLLQELGDLEDSRRTARYRCVMVYMRDADDPMPIIAEGTLEGRILHAPQGEGGFGYDPLFWLEAQQCAAAELSLEDKNRISHRAQASHQLVDRLKQAGLI